MTRQSLLSEAPFGEALRQAGPRAAKWLEQVGTQWLVDLAGELPAPVTTTWCVSDLDVSGCARACSG